MNVYRILHFLSNVCFDKVVWAPAPVVVVVVVFFNTPLLCSYKFVSGPFKKRCGNQS